jgi:hypothetical protein
MDNLFEYLIPLIFIVSFLASRKKKKQKAAEKNAAAGEPVKSGGLFGKLNKLMEEYQEADLKGVPKAADKSGTWVGEQTEQAPPYREPEPWEDEEEYEDEYEDKHEDEYESAQPEPVRTMPQEAVTQSSIVTPEPQQPDPVPQPKIEPQKPAVREIKPVVVKAASISKSPLVGYKLTGKGTLRRAVVWSEILGPPKALQDE